MRVSINEINLDYREGSNPILERHENRSTLFRQMLEVNLFETTIENVNMKL